jgi:NAD(P)H dehydrogenase (quinone)
MTADPASAWPTGGYSRLLIAGASGALGRLTADRLLAEGRRGELILVSRTPDALSDLAERGADARFGDFDEPGSLRDAFAGADRMLLISASDIEVRAEQHRSAIRSASEAGVRHIVYTSGLNPEPPNPAVIAPSHYATERALRESDLSWTVLRNSLYAEYQVPEAAQALAAGELVHNRGDGLIAYVSRSDCAAVAAARSRRRVTTVASMKSRAPSCIPRTALRRCTANSADAL